MRPTSTGNALKRQPGNNATGLIGSGVQVNAAFEKLQKSIDTEYQLRKMRASLQRGLKDKVKVV